MKSAAPVPTTPLADTRRLGWDAAVDAFFAKSNDPLKQLAG